MAVSSMTGFARAAGASGAMALGLRDQERQRQGARLASADAAAASTASKPEARARLAKALARGTCFATLTAQREGAVDRRAHRRGRARRDRRRRARRGREGRTRAADDGRAAGPARRRRDRRDGGRRGGGRRRLRRRAREPRRGDRRAHRGPPRPRARRWPSCSSERLDAIEALTQAADANPARRPEAVRARLAESVAALMDSSRGFDENRLHQEAILLAAKADIREELDRLKTHVAAARALARRGRRDRTAARLPRPGVRPRGQHALRQGERRHADRAGA